MLFVKFRLLTDMDCTSRGLPRGWVVIVGYAEMRICV